MLNDGGHKLWSVTEFFPHNVLVDNDLNNETDKAPPRSFYSRMEDDKLLLENNVSSSSDREVQREYNLAPKGWDGRGWWCDGALLKAGHLWKLKWWKGFGDGRIFMTLRTTDKQFEVVMKLCLKKQILEHGELDLEAQDEISGDFGDIG